MPTGYTADVAEGKVTDLRTFVLRCARQFGACIMQRDDPMDAPPKLREESDYYAKRVAELEAEVDALAAMTVDEARAKMEAEHAERVAADRRYTEERVVTRVRYSAMLERVESWDPPTPDHEKLKEFMVQQLSESIRFDCGGSGLPIPKPKSAALWLLEKRERATEELTRARRSLAEERERVEDANRWITALYDSLRETVPA